MLVLFGCYISGEYGNIFQPWDDLILFFPYTQLVFYLRSLIMGS